MQHTRSSATVLLMALGAAAAGCAYHSHPHTVRTPPHITTMAPRAAVGGDDGTLVVALFPYVPRYDDMKQTLTTMWDQLGTGVTLQFVDGWDCYKQDPPPNAEVIVYDAVEMQYFLSINALQPVPLDDVDSPSDLFPIALNCVNLGNGRVAGIPQLMCTNAMYYRTGDTDIQNAAGYIELAELIGPNPAGSFPLPQGQGLYFDLSGGTTDALLYVQTNQILQGVYTTTPPLPAVADLDSFTLQWLSVITAMGG